MRDDLHGAPNGKPWSRRAFLEGAGVSIGLPLFASLLPKAVRAEEEAPPTRLIFMSSPYGFVPNASLLGVQERIWNFQSEFKETKGWFPEEEGAEYTMPEVHAALEPLREHFSFIKGLANRRYRADQHNADDALLTCADTLADPTRAFTNTISCDQVAAAAIGRDVRVPSLTLGIPAFYGTHSGGLSWSSQGVPISPLQSPATVFDRLFGKDDVPAAERMQRLRDKKSVLDVTLQQIKGLNRKLNAADRNKLDEVVSAVRGVEEAIQRDEKWLNVPKPKVELERPDKSISTKEIPHTRAMFDLIHAAFLTDTTRVVTYELPEIFKEVTKFGKHEVHHPNGDPEKAVDAVKQDRAVSDQIAYMMTLMLGTKESDGKPMLHHTVAALSSGMWGPHHWVASLPMLLIGHGGGRIRQGVTRSYPKHTPMANLWLTMMKAAGVRADAFADSTGVLNEILVA